MRSFQLGAARFWYDEAYTVLVVRADPAQAIAAVSGDTHPPFYYLLTWLWVRVLGNSDALVHRFATNEFFMRIPSLILSMWACWLAWQIGKRLGWGNLATWSAIAFVCLSPFQIHFAQEARMYTLFQVLALSAFLAVWDRRWPALWGWSVAMLYTHNYALFTLPALWLIGMIRSRQDRPHLLRLNLAFIGALLCWLPWFVVLVSQMESIDGHYWIMPVNGGAVIYSLYMLFWSFSMPGDFQVPAVMLTAGALIYTGYWLVKNKPAGALELGILALVPLILSVGASLIWQPILLFRGLIVSAIPLYFLVARAFTEGGRRAVLYSALLFVPITAAGVGGHYLNNVESKGEVVEWIQLVREGWQDGDQIVHINDGTAVSWIAYAPDLPQAELHNCGADPLGALTLQSRRAVGIREISEPPAGRYWLVWTEGPTSPACEPELAGRLIDGLEPVVTIRDDELIHSGVWLVNE